MLVGYARVDRGGLRKADRGSEHGAGGGGAHSIALSTRSVTALHREHGTALARASRRTRAEIRTRVASVSGGSGSEVRAALASN